MVNKPKRRGRPRTRPIRLTEADRKLLSYPPTKGTWICQNRWGDENTLCATINGRNHEECILCKAPKLEEPVLLWGAYVKVCERFELDPELREPVKNIDALVKKGGEEEMRLFGRRKKVAAVIFPENVKVETPVAVEPIKLDEASPSVEKPKATRKPRTTKAATKPAAKKSSTASATKKPVGRPKKTS